MSTYLISCLQAALFKGYYLFCDPRLLCSEHDYTYLLIGTEVTSLSFWPPRDPSHPSGHPEISSNCHLLMLPSSHLLSSQLTLELSKPFLPSWLPMSCPLTHSGTTLHQFLSWIFTFQDSLSSPTAISLFWPNSIWLSILPSLNPTPIYSCILLHFFSSFPTSSLKCPRLQSTAPSWVFFLPDYDCHLLR